MWCWEEPGDRHCSQVEEFVTAWTREIIPLLRESYILVDNDASSVPLGVVGVESSRARLISLDGRLSPDVLSLGLGNLNLQVFVMGNIVFAVVVARTRRQSNLVLLLGADDEAFDLLVWRLVGARAGLAGGLIRAEEVDTYLLSADLNTALLVVADVVEGLLVLTRTRVQIALWLVLGAHRGAAFDVGERGGILLVVAGSGRPVLRLLIPDVFPFRLADAH